MLKKSLLVILLLLCERVSAQEMWGISNGNYSGNMGIYLNPSTIVGAPYRYEYHLLSGDIFAENTYIYFPKEERVVINALQGDLTGEKIYEVVPGRQAQFGSGRILITGPSFIDNRGEWAWGFHTAFRNEESVHKLPTDLGYLLYSNFEAPVLFNRRLNSEPFSAAFASWIELGGTYGRAYIDNEKNYLKWAATGNILVGMNGGYLDMRGFDYTVLDTSLTVIHNMDATVGHAMDGSFIGFRGLGLGTTVGVTYMRKRNRGGFECNRSNDNVKKYKYRVGVSLMDLGMIRYFNDSRELQLRTGTDRFWPGIDTVEFGSASNFDSTMVNIIGGTVEEKNISVLLPFAASVQFDYAITKNIYANASFVNRIKTGPNMIARPNQMNISVRYEKRAYEANINYSMFEYRQSALGIGLRYKFFIIGTDRLLEIAGLSDVKSFDFFFGFKFQMCKPLFGKEDDCDAYR